MKELAKQYDPSQVEDRIYQFWQDGGYFHTKADPDKKPYTIVMPPPNVTGQLHMGHAVDNTMQDILIRTKRMQGYAALWVPGTDHASIATEAKVVEAMRQEGLTKEMVGRDGFLERAWDWKTKYGNRIVSQLKKLGSSCDWERERFTMDEGLSEAVKKVFVELYNKGYIYRGQRMINWCPVAKSALSDEEYYTALTEAAVRAFIKKTGMPTRKYRDIYYNVWIYSSPICLGEETDAVERFRRCTDWNIMPILREFRDMLLDYLKNSDSEERAALYDRINSTVYKKWSPMNEAEALIDRVGADEWNAALERARTYVKENEAFLKNRYADAEGGYDYWWTEAHHQASLQQFTVAGIVRDAGITREELEGLLEKFIFPRYGEGCPTRVESIAIDLDGLYENLDHYADLLGTSGYAYPFLVDLLYVGDELMTYAPPDEVQTEIAEQSIRGFMKRW